MIERTNENLKSLLFFEEHFGNSNILHINEIIKKFKDIGKSEIVAIKALKQFEQYGFVKDLGNLYYSNITRMVTKEELANL